MNVCIVQPPYSTDYTLSDRYFQWELDAFDRCNESMDLIVFPESSATPCMAHSAEQLRTSYDRYFHRLVDKARETAKRCDAIVFFNAHDKRDTGYYNTTFAIDRQGNIVGKYDKQHLTPGEVSKMQLQGDYTFEHTTPTVVEIEGLRYCFLTCYDFYFYEAYPTIARLYPDIIIGCSHQRSDKQSALEVMNRHCAYNCNAYVVRASVSMDESSDIGGGSCVVAPDGQVLLDMKSRIGLETVEIDPKKKYYKPAGFGNPDAAHHEYIEKGRRPWKYRPAGSAICKTDALMPYPRVCAHRGFSSIAPENSMPAFGAAVAMGAQEIEFDLWWTKDGQIVSIHDAELDRVSNGSGYVFEHTLAELKALDFGSKAGAEFAGMQIPTFEEILKKFSCHVVMNIHIKTLHNVDDYDPARLQKIIDLIHAYDCEKYVYFMSGNDKVLALAQKMAPHIPRCAGGGRAPWQIVERAMQFGCYKVQFFKPYFNQDMIDKAHANGIMCNVFWSDDPDEAKQFWEMGIDTILTNDYHRISRTMLLK